MAFVNAVRELIQAVEEKAIPLVDDVDPTGDQRKRFTETFARMEVADVCLPFVVELRAELGQLRSSINVVGATRDAEKPAAKKAVRELDLVLLSFVQYFQRKEVM
jgi:hypothetical protein